MKVIEPGHIYELPSIDAPGMQYLVFINTQTGQEHSGTISQEVIRVLIDRLKHKDAQVPCIENKDLIYHARMMLLTYEARAYRRKIDKLNGSDEEHSSFRERDKDVPFDDLGWFGGPRTGIEMEPVGKDGHLEVQVFPHFLTPQPVNLRIADV